MMYLQQLVAPSLALLIAFIPFFTDVAKADTAGNVMVSQIDLSTANTNSVSGTGGGVQAGHFELYQTATGGHLLHGTVSDGSQTTAIDFDGSMLALADGYSMKVEVTADTPTQAVTKLSVTTADHRHATGSMHLDKQTQQVTQVNMPAVQSLILESGDEAVVNAALPVLLAIAKAQDLGATSNLVGTSDGIIHCMIAWLALAVEAAGLILACGIPEPVEPLACGLAVTGFIIAGGEAGHACG